MRSGPNGALLGLGPVGVPAVRSEWLAVGRLADADLRGPRFDACEANAADPIGVGR
jgi:hypothetical protein